MTAKTSSVNFVLHSRFQLHLKLRSLAATKRRAEESGQAFQAKVKLNVLAIFGECQQCDDLTLDPDDDKMLRALLRIELAKFHLSLSSVQQNSARTSHITPNGDCRLDSQLELTVE